MLFGKVKTVKSISIRPAAI